MLENEEDITYKVGISLNKAKATIEIENSPNASQFAHCIAFLIIGLDDNVEGDMSHTIKVVLDAIDNIKGNI